MRERKVERNNEIYGLYLTGMSQKEIAERFGLSRGRVCKIIDYFRIRPYLVDGLTDQERKDKALENLAKAKTVTDPSRRVEMICKVIKER